MPLYEYQCDSCGVFDAMRPMAQSADPCDCPACGTTAPRVMFTAPRLAAMDTGLRHAHATNERSADSPRTSRDASSHRHGPGCGCGSGTSKAVHRPDGSKTFPSKRPWMISH
ncbi:MAG: FmdB family transcriptional regulator [Rhodospirillaceae bacterium]|nr:FmdB family transcriptional regulator [Rhodospirillaceae bacterium]